LGGLLLGAAAVAFTAVAWVTYGVTVRAAILAAGTALALAAAPPLRRRGLPGTAETCTALGVLLLLLDGYAARSVDLFGLRDVGAAGYAAAVCAGTAALSWAYARAVDVAAGRYAAWLVAQPVALLVAGAAGAAAAGYALALAVQAWGNAALLGRARRAGLRVLAGIGLVAAAAGAALVGVAATLLTAGVVPAAGAAAGAALAAAAACYGAYRLPGARVRDLGDAAAVAGTGTALAAWCATAWPSGRLLAVPAVALVYASAHLALRHRLVPRARRSTQYAVAAGVAVGAVPVLATSAGAALDAIGRGAGTAAPPWGWLPLVALGLTGAAVRLLAAAGPLRAVLDPHRRDAAVVAAAVAAPLVGAALALPGWGVALLAAAVAALAAPAAALAARGSSAALRAATAGFLGAYALLLPVARPAVLAGVASLLLAGALAAAVRADPGSPAHRVVGGLAAAAAVLLTPLALVQALAAAGVPAWWQARAYLAALAGLVAATWWLGRRRRAYRGYAAAPVLLLSALLPLWAGAGSTREPLALYAGLALLAVSAVVHLARARPGAAALAALLPALTWLVACGPALANVVLLPLAWLTDIWSGRPAGVGLSPVPTFRVSPAVPGGVLLAFAAVALVRARPRGRRTALWVCAAGAVAAAPLLSAGLEAPWPATPAVSLVLGLGALAAAARYGAAAAARPVAAAAVGLPLALAGLAGTLPTARSTLAGLGLVCLVATGVAATARLLGARMAAAAAATAAGLTGVGAAGAAAGLTRPWTGVAVLGGVLAAVAVEAALRTSRPGEAAAVEMAGGAGLVVALLLTVGSGRHAALVCALWGIAMGARALRPGETRHRRRGHLAAG
ncbi:MAG TPA: hypothetical protein VFY17_08060, partial [Pilimelia sp.]|nr:hypothetical protein [Pilimelia sp.]